MGDHAAASSCLYLDIDHLQAAAKELNGKLVPLTKDVHDTDSGTRGIIMVDNEGHTLYFGESQ